VSGAELLQAVACLMSATAMTFPEFTPRLHATKVGTGQLAVNPQKHGGAPTPPGYPHYPTVGGLGPEGAVADATIAGDNPIGIAAGQRAGRVFTADACSDQVSAIETRTQSVITSIPVGSCTAGLGIDEPRRRPPWPAQASHSLVRVSALRLALAGG